jgi:Leucine-rich repeat (LRR) protein
LSDLDLGNNTLTTLPAGVFCDLGALSVLNLGNNALTIMRAGVFSVFSHTYNVPLHELAGLNNLMFLDVSRNMLSDLPPVVFTGLSNLTSLVLTYNKFHHLPPVLSDLTALTVLDVWEGNHDGIWTDYQGWCIFAGNSEGAPLVRTGSCPQIEVLDIHYLNINQLPEDAFRGKSSLRTLNLGSNALTTLPAGVFSDLSALRDLDIGIHTLTNLPS